MPMQERLIASVLVPAQTQPKQKNQADLDSGGTRAVLFGIFALLGLSIALAMRQSNKQKQVEIQEIDTRKQQNKLQEAEDKQKRIKIAEEWDASNISLIKEHKYTLYKIRLELTEEDDYGNLDVDGWGQFSNYAGVPIGDVKDNAFVNERGFKRGFPYFWKNVLVSGDDFRGDAWFDGWWKYKIEKLGRHSEVEWYEVILDWISEHAMYQVAEELDAQEEERTEAGYSDDMSGEDYEIYCGRILQ